VPISDGPAILKCQETLRISTEFEA